MKCGFFSFFRNIFGVSFFVILTILLFFENVYYFCEREYLLPNYATFGIVIMILLLGICFYYWTKNKRNLLLNNHTAFNSEKWVILATVILFLGQCYVFYNTFFVSGWDTEAIRVFVDTIIEDGDRGVVNEYFSRFPNNLLISYLYVLIQKINISLGVFNGEYSYMCVVILNCAINSFSCWLTFKTARTFVSPVLALVAYILCVFSVGISGWTGVCYSDSLALFVPILCVYLYCKPYKNTKGKSVGVVSAVFLSAIGYFIKPQCLFVFIAIVILEALKLVGNFSLKKLLRPIALCLVAVVVFSFTNIGIDFLNKKHNIEIDKEQSFGFAHFLMMGANEESSGVFSEEDAAFSDSFDTSNERNKANINVFLERVTSMKNGLIAHLTKKMLTTFNDGTFAWGDEGSFLLSVPENINNKMAPFLKSIYHFGNKFLYFATFQHLVWLFILVCSALTVVSRKNNYDQCKLSLIWIILLGFVLYELLFEVRARYVYIFVPLFCVLAPIGIRNIGKSAVDFLPRIKGKLKK